MMMEDTNKLTVDLIEEAMKKHTAKIDEKLEMVLTKMMVSTRKLEKTEEEVYNFSDDEISTKFKPSRRDRQSIASIFTSNPPFTPASETKVKKDLKMPQFLKDYNKNITDGNENAANSNLVTEILIPESAKYTTVSLKTIKLATEKLQLYRTENPVGASKLRLAYFFNITAMETIYNKQITLKNNILENYENPTRFYACNDDVFLAFLCDTVRPVSAEDHLLKLFTVIQPDYIDEEFQLKNFHKGPLTKAMNQINKLQTYDAFII